MVKSMFKGSTIEIWQKDYVNKDSCWMVIDEKDKNAEIIQIEHAYEDYFIVEVVRRDKKGTIVLPDFGVSILHADKVVSPKEVNDERSE